MMLFLPRNKMKILVLGLTLFTIGYYVKSISQNVFELDPSLARGIGNKITNNTILKRQKVPKILHYAYPDDPENRPFTFIHWLAMTSAIETIKPKKTLFHCVHEPESYWYQLIKPKISVVKARIVTEIFGNPVKVLQHKSDIIRMEALRDYGGIYLDLDVLVFKPFDDLLYDDFTMGIEMVPNAVGLCNAVMISRPFAPFLTRWIEQYKYFDDNDYNYHSVLLPYNLSKKYEDDILVLNETAFFWPTWVEDHLKWVHTSNEYDFSNQYAYHMWFTRGYKKYLRRLTPTLIRNVETSFNKVVRKFLNYLPDNFNEEIFKREMIGENR